VAWADLHERLQRIFVSRAERVAFVRGDDDIDFQYLADVIDIARNSGVQKVALLGSSSKPRVSSAPGF
jgi:biopolymer transport protein TolR